MRDVITIIILRNKKRKATLSFEQEATMLIVTDRRTYTYRGTKEIIETAVLFKVKSFLYV